MSWEGILRLPGAPRRCSLEPWTRIRFAPWYADRRTARKTDEPERPLQVFPSLASLMPELPEVETTCRGVRPHVEGRTLSALVVRNARLRLPVPPDLAHQIEGRVLQAVSRRAKYLLFDFGHGSLIVHLGMSGSLRVVASTAAPGTHDHVDLVFGAHALRLRDPRRFGLVVWQAGEAAQHPLLARLGPEPLDEAFTADWLHRVTRGLRAPIKHVLMTAIASSGSATSMPRRACFGPASIRCTRPERSGRGVARAWCRPCARRLLRPLPRAAAPCVILSVAMASPAISSSNTSSMGVMGRPADSAARGCNDWSAPSVRAISARAVSVAVERSALVGRRRLLMLRVRLRMAALQVRRYAHVIM